jgi:hypothetical protein
MIGAYLVSLAFIIFLGEVQRRFFPPGVAGEVVGIVAAVLYGLLVLPSLLQ